MRKGYLIMTRFILGSMLYILAAMSAFAGPGYYEMRVSDCTPAAMQRAADSLAAENRAVISVVKCDAAAMPAVPEYVQMPAPVYVARPVVYADVYDDIDCDCDMDYYF